MKRFELDFWIGRDGKRALFKSISMDQDNIEAVREWLNGMKLKIRVKGKMVKQAEQIPILVIARDVPPVQPELKL